MSPQEAQQWMARYYEHPAPERLVAAIAALAQANILKGQKLESGFLSRWFSRRAAASIDVWQPNSDAPLIAFVAKLCEPDPARIEGCFAPEHALTEAQKRSLWIAAWLSRAPNAGALIRRQAHETSKAAEQFVAALLRQAARPIESLPLTGPVVLDMNWAAFFATGEARYVLRVVEALGSVASAQGTPEFVLGSAALWSLRSNAAQHPTVRATCAALLPQTTSGMRLMLESIVNGTSAAPT